MLDLEPIKKRLKAATPGPWYSDTTKSEGSYGSGPDTHEGYNAYELCVVINEKVEVLADSLNSTYGMVDVEYDEDGASAWDDIARRNFDLIADAPTDMAAMVAEIEILRDCLRALANSADAVGVKHLDSDDMSDEAVSMQQVTQAARHILSATT